MIAAWIEPGKTPGMLRRWGASLPLRALVTMLLGAVSVGFAGCEKPPTAGELFGYGKKETPKQPVAAPQPPPQQQAAAAPTPPPKPPEVKPRSPQEIMAEFKNTPPELRSDKQLAELASMKEGIDQLTEIDLTRSNVSDAGLRVLPKFESLDKLIIDNCKYSSAGLKNVAEIKGLTSLSMKAGPWSDTMHDAALANITPMRNLKELRIDQVRFSPAGLRAVCEMEGLEKLSVASTQFSDSDLANVGKLTGLKELNISGTQISDAGCQALAGLKNLESLGMAMLRDFRGQGLKDLVDHGNLKKLRILNLYDDHGLLLPAWEAIRKLKSLEYLDVTHSACNDYYFTNAISGHSKLEFLGIGDTAFTDVGMQRLPKLTNLKKLSIDAAGITDLSNKQIAKLKDLQVLNIRATHCTEAGIRVLKKKLPEDCLVVFNQRKVD